MGTNEFFRNSELNLIKRIYPGFRSYFNYSYKGIFYFSIKRARSSRSFDPLDLASIGRSDICQIERLKESEIKHSRLAMISFLGKLNL